MKPVEVVEVHPTQLGWWPLGNRRWEHKDGRIMIFPPGVRQVLSVKGNDMMKPPLVPPGFPPQVGRVDWSPDFMSNKTRSAEFIAMRVASERLGYWLSAALEDPGVCEDMKRDIRSWFDALKKL